MDQQLPLDLIGALSGTDKAAAGHDYLDSYQLLFEPWRDAAFNFIEIGVLHGASVKMWKTFFSKASIVGLDVRPECVNFAEDRVTIMIGSQDDPAFLYDVCRQNPPTIVVDDGSHWAHHVLFTFERVFPYVLPGGLYVIEDLDVHLGPDASRVRGPATITPPEYLLDLSRRIVDGRIKDSENHGLGRYLLDQVESITFIRHAAIIRKKRSRQRLADSFPAAERMVEASGSAMQFSGLSNAILAHGGPPERAEAMARRAVEIEPSNALYQHRLANILEHRGAAAETLAAARAAVEAEPGNPSYWFHLSRLDANQQQFDAAEASARRAVALDGGRNVHFLRQVSAVLEMRGNVAGALEATRAARAACDMFDPSMLSMVSQDQERLDHKFSS